MTKQDGRDFYFSVCHDMIEEATNFPPPGLRAARHFSNSKYHGLSFTPSLPLHKTLTATKSVVLSAIHFPFFCLSALRFVV